MKVLRYCALFLAALTIQASAIAQTTDQSVEGLLADVNKPADVRVVIDISGSMKLNDPHNLRRPALELLVKLFPEDAKAGVWTFGQWVNMLVKHGPVDKAWRAKATKAAQSINSVALHTNIPAALEKAAMNLDKLDPKFSTHMILLTDGMVDVSKSPEENAAARQRIIDEILPKLRDAGITIHTVALSKNADSELMERLAVETNGLTAVAETAEDLMEVFLQAFDAAAPAEQLPLDGNKFVVDSSIEEFTALIFKTEGSEPAVLVSPDGQRSSEASNGNDVNWFSEKNYDLITVKSPYEGEWTIVADLEPGSRVTIVSNLSLIASRLAASMFVGGDNEISVLFQEQGKTIMDQNLLSLVDIQVSVARRDDGQEWTFSLTDERAVPSNGLFSDSLAMLAEAGVYDISVRADGKSFQRVQKQTVAVRETFDIKQQTTDDTPPNHSVTLFAQNPSIDTDGSTVLARVKRPDGSSALKAVSVVAERTWQISLSGIKQSGLYTVTFEATGQYKSGGRFDFSSETVEVIHNVPGSMPIPEVVKPLVEPKPEPTPEPKQEPKPEPKPEPVADEGIDWQQIMIYVGIALANIMAIGLGYMAYKMVTGAGGSSILEASDDVDLDDEPVAEAEQVAEPEQKAPEPSASELDISSSDLASVDDIDDLGGLDELADVEPEAESDTVAIEDELDIDDDDIAELADVDDILDLPDDAIDIDPDK